MRVEFAKNLRLFHRSKFQKSRSLRDFEHFLNSIFDHFRSKKQTFLNIEKSFGAKIWHTTRKEDAENAGENRRALALPSVEILTKKCIFLKCHFLTKNVNFRKNCWSDRSENLQVGAQDDFEKMKFEKGGAWKF